MHRSLQSVLVLAPPRRVYTLISLLLLAVLAVAASPAPAGAVAQSTYIVRVDAKGSGETEFTGFVKLNGKQSDLETKRTPWTLRCKADDVVSGRVKAVDPKRTLVVKVFESGYSMHEPSISGWGHEVEFAWAQPGSGPRLVREVGSDSH